MSEIHSSLKDNWKRFKQKDALFLSVFFSIILSGLYASSSMVATIPHRYAFDTSRSFPKTAPDARVGSPDLRLVVISDGRRMQSVRTLLRSACLIESDGDRIDLDVWVDAPQSDNADFKKQREQLVRDIEALETKGTFRHGIVRAHMMDEHVGVIGQWMDAWHLSIPGGLREDTAEVGLMLEDDLELSPYAWRWLKAAHAKYGNDERIAGITLQRLDQCAAAHCPPLNGGPEDTGGAFLYPVIGTWGYSPIARSFATFRGWYRSLDADSQGNVSGVAHPDWQQAHLEEQMLRQTRMWSVFHIKYTDTHGDKYTVYAMLKDKAALISKAKTGELKHDKEPVYALVKAWDYDLIRFADDPLILNYSAAVISGTGL